MIMTDLWSKILHLLNVYRIKFYQTEVCIMEVGKKTSHMEMDQQYTNQDHFTKDNTFLGKQMEWVDTYVHLEIGTRDNLRMMFQRVMGLYITPI